MTNYPVTTSMHDGILVVRDDKLEGGSKRRALTPDMLRLAGEGHEEFVFGGPAEGYAQLALAYSAKEIGVRATYFVAKRKQPHRNTVEAIAAGIKAVEIPHGRLSVVQYRARTYCAETGAYFYPLGFATPEYEAELTKQISAALEGLEFSETWACAGSGLLTRCMQAAAPSVNHHAVRIGFPPKVGDAILFDAPEAFADEAASPPPFPSAANYDAKVWRFIKEHAKPGALFWNVGR